MNIPFEMSDTDDVNAANPCCCPESPCAYAQVEYQSREVDQCLGGFFPYFGDGAFDLQTYGKLMPLYKVSTDTTHQTTSGTVSQKWEYSADHVVYETFQWNATTNYDFGTTIADENQKLLEEWPAGSEPLGPCPPESTIFAIKASASGVKIESAVDGLVPVILSTPETRPNHPTEVDGEGNPAKAGYFEWRVDGSFSGTGGAEFTISLSEGDTTCHEFTVRHVCGGNGQWSKPKVFSLNSNPCCKVPEKPGCSDYTTGNTQWSASQQYLSDGGTTWTSTYTGETPSSDNGTGSACSGSGPDNVPPGLTGGIFGSIFTAYFPLEGATLQNADTVTTGRTVNEETTTWTWIENYNADNPLDPEEPDPAGWRVSSQHDNGTASYVEKTIRSNDQNQGTSSVDRLFSKALEAAKAQDKTYGWSDGGSEARATGGYPETQGGSSGVGVVFVNLQEIRYRWYVPEDHDGTAYKTQWNVGRFHDRWLTWRGEYYAWAVAKYAFLQKPKPGDENYPKLADFWNDPSTPENEAKESLKAAIDAINAIEDPGKAPEEPKDLKPEITDSPAPWVWNITQGEQPDETIDACDPTKYARELHEPTKPKREDYPSDEAFKIALEAYKAALASYKSAVAARKAASKRQSPWRIVTPDKWSDYRTKPDPVPDLPADADAAEKLAHENAVKQYDFLLGRYNSTHHASLFICNVRYTCNIGDPNGEIENWDKSFPTTELPPLDPAKENPAIWAEWY